jgi:EcoRII C terminal
MKKGHLSEYFEGVAVKQLSAVDADPRTSNQHEIGTTPEMRKFLGEIQKNKFDVNYIWLGDEQEGFSYQDCATHYDTRLNQPNRRPEWRLYYSSNPVTEIMREGDTLFLAKQPGDCLLFVIVRSGSTIENQLLWLFGFDSQPDLKFLAQEYSGDNDATLDFAARFVLDELGIEFEDPDANSLDTIIERFGLQMPKTYEFSALARLTLPEVRAEEGPDTALMAWLDHEEAMFRRLERRIVSARIEQGFINDEGVDVDGFLSFSLSVQNRRKSRMGQSFEHHLAAVFDAFKLSYTKGGKTERNNKPDFLFPGQAAYSDPAFPDDQLNMLAAKTICKERWRQILPEADRISRKHLVTLEPSISTAQTAQMQAHDVQLVVPLPIHASYRASQTEWLWTLEQFVKHASNLGL